MESFILREAGTVNEDPYPWLQAMALPEPLAGGWEGRLTEGGLKGARQKRRSNGEGRLRFAV